MRFAWLVAKDRMLHASLPLESVAAVRREDDRSVSTRSFNDDDGPISGEERNTRKKSKIRFRIVHGTVAQLTGDIVELCLFLIR